MTTGNATPKNSRVLLWIGRILSLLIVLFMGVMPLIIFFANPEMVSDGMVKYGYPKEAAMPILITEILCALIYAIPQTSILGAILLTGYLGGAVATHVHAAEFGQIPLPALMGVLIWLALYFREPRLRPLVPLRSCRKT